MSSSPERWTPSQSALYQNQKAVLKAQYLNEKEYASLPAWDKTERKMDLRIWF
jgi:hypothetical protein